LTSIGLRYHRRPGHFPDFHRAQEGGLDVHVPSDRRCV
jgi:hypothetical protein